MTALHPLRERLWELRMTALYRSGRQADAVAAFQTARRHLREEVGMEPGPRLRALAEGVLRHTLPTAPPPGRPTRSAVPFDGPHYADAGGVHVAWGAYGMGAADVLLLNPTFVPLDAYLEEPHLAAAIERLAAGRRVIAFDRSGLGLSDPVTPDTPPSVTGWTDDAVAVLDACGARRVHVLANADTAMIALMLAATRPERVASVTAVNPYARVTVGDGYPHGEPPTVDEVLRGIRTPDARPPVDVLSWIAPSVAGDVRVPHLVGRGGAAVGEPAHGGPRAPGDHGRGRARPAPPGRRARAAASASTALHTTRATAATSPPTCDGRRSPSTPTRTACGSSATSTGCSTGSPPSSPRNRDCVLCGSVAPWGGPSDGAALLRGL